MDSTDTLVFDLGGTKLEAGVVDTRTGELRRVHKVLLDLERGKDHVMQEFIAIGRALITEFPGVRAVGVSSAGPLNPRTGELLDPTNLLTNGKGWGLVPLKAILEAGLNLPVTVDNDAACAVLAERWLGVGRGNKGGDDMVLVTLGTGVGVGVLCNGTLFRAGRHLHPEVGHTILQMGDKDSPCGCGIHGDVEAYLSGKNFAAGYNRRHGTALSPQDIVAAARRGDVNAKAAFVDYSLAMAALLQNVVVLFWPEIVVFAGSFAEAFDCFAPQAEAHLRTLLPRRMEYYPQIAKSALENHACLLGAATLTSNRPCLHFHVGS